MGLLNEIPAEIAENLEVGHTMMVPLDEDVNLEVGLTTITVHHADRLLILDADVVTNLTHVLVTRDLMIRANTKIKPCTDHDHGHNH